MQIISHWCLLFFIAMASPSTELTKNQQLALDSVSKGTASFALDLYNALKKTPGNLIFSPLSVQLVLALAYSGAKRTTAEEIAKALLLPEKLDDVLEGYRLLLNLLDDPSLSVANKMFIEESYEVLESFQTSAETYFKAGADAVSFMKNSEEARAKINDWVETKTNNKIKDLLQKGSLFPDTKLVLVNAIHFKADWSIKFEKKLTKPKPFHISKNEKVNTQMMHMTKKLFFLYNAELKVKALKLMYANSDLAMLILLPDEIDGLAELETKLSSINLSETFRHFEHTKVEVQLPKFKTETTMDLKDILKSLGMKAMFSDQAADFSGISSQSNLVVNKVVQKAFVEVNEEGTEAAAATCMSIRMRRSLCAEENEEFFADHPFLYIITNNANNSMVMFFIGRYTLPDPSAIVEDSHEDL